MKLDDLLKKYLSQEMTGGDSGPSDMEYAERILLPQIIDAKSQKELNKVKSDFISWKKRHSVSFWKKEDKTIEGWFKQKEKELS
jgi:hypothetical protein